MEIKKVTNGLIAGYEIKADSEPKNEQKNLILGVASAANSFENLDKLQLDSKSAATNSSTSEQKGSNDLNLDQARLASGVNFENFPKETSDTKDGRSNYEDSKNNNPYRSGSSDSNTPQDRINDRNQGAVDRSGPSGPDVASKVNQLLDGNFTFGDRYSEYQRKDGPADLRKGASGQALLDSASQDQKQNTSYGKEMISQSGGMGYKGIGGYDDSEGVKGGSGKAAKENPGLNEAVKQTYVFGGAGSSREYGLLSSQDDFNPRDYTRSDGTRVQTGKDGTVVETAKDGTKTVTKPDGSSTTVKPDGSYQDKDASGKNSKDKNGKGDKLTDPGENPGVSPEQAGLIGWQKLSPGAMMPRTGSQGGDIDPTEDDLPAGVATDDSHVRLTKIRNSVAQPADPEGVNTGRPIGGAPNGGGDIDYGPDSLETGFSGTSRGGDPTDLDLNVGGAPLKPIEDSSNSNDEDKKKTKSNRLFILRT